MLSAEPSAGRGVLTTRSHDAEHSSQPMFNDEAGMHLRG